VTTGLAVTLLPLRLSRFILFIVIAALAFTFLAVSLRDLIRPLLIAIIVLGTLQNVPLVSPVNAARAGGAPEGLVILPSDLAVAALALVLLAYHAIRRRPEERRKRLPHGFVVGLTFCAWGGLTALWSFAPALSLSETFRDSITFATWLIIASCLLMDINLIRVVCAGFVLATMCQSVLALMQWLTGGTLGLAYLGIIQVERDLTNDVLIRVGGTLGHPNFLGGYLALSLPMAGLGAFVFKRRWQRGLAGLTLLLGLAALIVTASRGAYLAVAIEVGLAGILIARARITRISATTIASGVAAAIGAVVIYLNLGSFAAYRIMENDPTTQYRWVLIQTALSMFWSHPLLGTGLNTFTEFLNAHYESAAATMPQLIPVHNLFLLILAETGIVGLVLFVAWLGLPIFGAIRNRRMLSADHLVILSGCLVAMVGALVIGMIDLTMRHPALELTVAVVLAGITAIWVSSEEGQRASQALTNSLIVGQLVRTNVPHARRHLQGLDSGRGADAAEVNTSRWG
jgi:O-antigen ligase